MIPGPITRRFAAMQPRILSQRQYAKSIISSRPFSYTRNLQARKDTQDKDSLKPEPYEYSKSGTDDQAARVEQTAFDPSKTSPEEQHDAAGSESKDIGQDANPLNVSPANRDVSKTTGPEQGGSENQDPGSASQSGGKSERSRTSGGGSPSKGSEGQKYSS